MKLILNVAAVIVVGYLIYDAGLYRGKQEVTSRVYEWGYHDGWRTCERSKYHASLRYPQYSNYSSKLSDIKGGYNGN